MIVVMSAWCLSMHALWRCRHSGACCRAGWAIPMEPPAFERVTAHFGRAAGAFATDGPLPEGAAAILGSRPGAACHFHAGNRCAIHAALGPAGLPAACRQFPRIALIDGRGTFIRLSHYCPTAASLLSDPGRVGIVAAPPWLTLDGDIEGLDARSVMPPLLRPGLLTDLEGYDAWERGGVNELATGHGTAVESLGAIAAATNELLSWNPDAGPMTDSVRRAYATRRAPATAEAPSPDVSRFAAATSAVPCDLAAPALPPRIGRTWHDASRVLVEHDDTVRAWLAAHLFGNWVAYSSRGLTTVVEYLRVCLAVLRVETVRQFENGRPAGTAAVVLQAIRESDLLLDHLLDTPALARILEHDDHQRAGTVPSLRHHRHTIG